MFIADLPYAKTLRDHLVRTVRFAIEEDLGSGDITAQLIPEDEQSTARVITREEGILCGREWFEEVFRQIDPTLELNWLKQDGDKILPNDALVEIKGNTRAILTAERTGLNFLQTLSGTATLANRYATAVDGKDIIILDTRKTIPCLRLAQKYATHVGGCQNHRLGLYDMFLIKENHIAGCGGIENAVKRAKEIAPDKRIEVEVETIEQLQEALNLPVDVIMLDNFDGQRTTEAVKLNANKIKLESSGNMDLDKIGEVISDHPDFVSVGKLTKHVTALDLSLRLVN
ncbi:carboxylating nicotinate-nucleotide diphosphorylase [Reinekea marinisedimentorum]|uniref:Probable nicotinate-nucleotide pyrophosphorylase [carboxylating] n=1 Tax=Reinekea marinisedimentorum TaxID=230495 RepID=A0A4R3I6H1_9GAMM|nr:carboxylating nicotinate-nucleotide diphosphorylase [Reinekea marinisedimentorum]TCS41694.1 nicotinate-nucleotide pyrophosphorylase (carboxylating) [Reinekea marinisedimentorum]